MTRSRYTPQAARDLGEIADYISARDPTAAGRVVEEIRQRCRALADMPGMGRPREEFAPGLRSSVVRKYLIFYRPDDKGIEVVRIVHGARDLPKLFE